jgi:DNA-directed RNA polymerase I, II, and III subunit RPABC5
MIIPVRCMTCGKLLGNKYNYFQKRVRESRGSLEPISLDGKSIPKTVEAEVYHELDLRRFCCKKSVGTHVEVIIKL